MALRWIHSGYSTIGEQPLKNIASPVRVYRVQLDSASLKLE